MRSYQTFALAVATTAVLATGHARAADLPPMLPPPPMMQEYGGWYLRGDIGMSNQRVKGIEHPAFVPPAGGVFEWLDSGSFDSGTFFGIGLGYEFNSWLRMDLTGEYRGKTRFSARDRVFDPGPVFLQINDYTARKSEWLFLWNTYVDLGTWKNITPFVGAGLGASRNTISEFVDVNPTTGGSGTAGTGHKWNFAWALHAGLAYDVTPNFTIELAYRYLNLGNAKTGDFRNDDPSEGCNATPPCYPVQFKNITSHDIKLGVRWAMADMGVSHWQPPMQPVYSKY